MLDTLKKLFGFGPKVDFAALLANGGIILDVRSPAEYNSGHVKGSMNIPLNTLQGQLSKLKKDKPVITCCASGMRSGSAKAMLSANGFAEVHNGGSWQNLKKYEK